MKILTANFVTCAVKTCKTSSASFPLHFKDAELEQSDMEYNPEFLRNILPRIEWEALRVTAAELGFTTLPETKPEPTAVPSTTESSSASPAPDEADAAAQDDTEMGDASTNADAAPASDSSEDDRLWRDLHTLLLQTEVMEGKMVCGNCGHEYKIKEGIANFLLPNHLV